MLIPYLLHSFPFTPYLHITKGNLLQIIFHFIGSFLPLSNHLFSISFFLFLLYFLISVLIVLFTTMSELHFQNDLNDAYDLVLSKAKKGKATCKDLLAFYEVFHSSFLLLINQTTPRPEPPLKKHSLLLWRRFQLNLFSERPTSRAPSELPGTPSERAYLATSDQQSTNYRSPPRFKNTLNMPRPFVRKSSPVSATSSPSWESARSRWRPARRKPSCICLAISFHPLREYQKAEKNTLKARKAHSAQGQRVYSAMTRLEAQQAQGIPVNDRVFFTPISYFIGPQQRRRGLRSRFLLPWRAWESRERPDRDPATLPRDIVQWYAVWLLLIASTEHFWRERKEAIGSLEKVHSGWCSLQKGSLYGMSSPLQLLA